MIENQLLAALETLERTRERIQTRGPGELGSPHMLTAMAGLAAGWLARTWILGGDR